MKTGIVAAVKHGTSGRIQIAIPAGVLSADYKAYRLSMNAGGKLVDSAPFQIPAAPAK